jgi:alpha-glucuronidase
VLSKLQYQAAYAEVWRDAVNDWFYRTSQIPDAQGRVGHHPGRIEAESMSLEGYTVEAITPWEGASGGKAVSCPVEKCSAVTRFDGTPDWYDIGVQYFDQNNGVARFQLFLGHQFLSQWTANDNLPTAKANAHTSTRHTIEGVALRPGDEIRIIGVPNSGERALVDYVEIKPSSRVSF